MFHLAILMLNLRARLVTKQQSVDTTPSGLDGYAGQFECPQIRRLEMSLLLDANVFPKSHRQGVSRNESIQLPEVGIPEAQAMNIDPTRFAQMGSSA